MNIGLIQEASEGGWLRSLAYFCRMKLYYYNNVMYNYSLRKLARLLGCSPGCLRSHLTILEREGLVKYEGNNIRFVGFQKLQEYSIRKQRTTKEIYLVNSGDFVSELRAVLLRTKLLEEDYQIRRSESRIRNVFVKSGKEMIARPIGISNLGFGKLLGMSQSTGLRVIKKLKQLGILDYQRLIQVLYRNVPFKEFLLMRNLGFIPQYAKYSDGVVFRDYFKQIIFSL